MAKKGLFCVFERYLKNKLFLKYFKKSLLF
jgi:hypothetical protein